MVERDTLFKNKLKRIVRAFSEGLSKKSRILSSFVERLLESAFIHPFLFSVYPTLFLYSHNITELLPGLLFLPIVASLLLAACILVVLYLITKGKYQSALITSSLMILFFSFSHLRQLFIDYTKVEKPNRVTMALSLLLLVLAVFFIYKQSKNLKTITKFLNVISIALFAFVSINILSYEIRTQTQPLFSEDPSENEANQVSQRNIDKRDIYYIVLDAYGRQDVLKEGWDYDNSEFLEYLKNRGFYVAPKSTSNYAFTHLSLPSTFNLKYLNYLTGEFGTERRIIGPILNKMFHENEVAKFLKSQGYVFINFDSGWRFTQNVPIADVNVREGRHLSIFGKNFIINDFYSLLLNMTALSPFARNTLINERRKEVLYYFNRISELPYERGNKLVLAHFVLPHPPYLFDAKGNPAPEDSPDGFDKKLDIEQLRFTNKLVESTIDRLLSRSNPKPIIIIASDHGPLIRGLEFPIDEATTEMIKQRMSILNAYYFPDGGSNLLYDTITPVNTFRILFNYYFGTDYELLEDKNYYSSGTTELLYKFYDVTNQLNNK